ncbi:hypothetical protein HZA96_02030 [Candidatus Woesearchaeota archaeon]|nr:hypothetical protein [Candidatus Woesearchaeota archaeon]
MSWKTVKHGENVPVFIVDTLYYSFTQQNIKKQLDIDFTFKRLLKLNEVLYFDTDEYNQFIALFALKLSTTKLNKCYLKYDTLLKKLNNKLKNLLRGNIKTKSTIVLDKLFIEIMDDYKDLLFYCFVLYIHSEQLTNDLVIQLKNHLKKNKEDLTYAYVACIYKNVPSYQEKQKKELLAIALDLSKDARLMKQITKKSEQFIEQIKKFRKIYAKIKTHLQQYSWINTDIGKYGTYDISEVVKQLKLLVVDNPNAQLISLKEGSLKNKNEYNTLIKNLKSSKNILKIIKNAEEFEDKKNSALMQLLQLQYSLKIFLEEIGARHELTFNELISLTYREIIGLIKLNLLNKDILRNRENEYAIIVEENKLKVLTAYNVQKLKESLTNEDFVF